MGLLSNFYETKLMPLLFDRLMEIEPLIDARRRALAGISGNIIEIGFGTGLSLRHYPKSVKKITTVDTNEGLNKKALARIKETGVTVENHVLSAETLPFADSYFDNIVSQMTLCSIDDVAGAVSELYRVLKPGGGFYFLEHGASPDPQVRKWQDRWNPIQKVIGGGCRCNRHIKHIIEEGGFEITQLENYYLGETPKRLGFMFQGLAIKRH
jgi:SAM-dependent methyltransferase